MKESIPNKELPDSFWISAQATCNAIFRRKPIYQSPPENQEHRKDIIVEIQDITQSGWIDARRLELQYIPAGWTTLVRDVLRSALYLLKQSDVRQLSILVGKEKFGEFRISFECTESFNLNRDLRYIQDWALEQSRTRCGGTGKLGKMTTSGRIIPLSPELLELSQVDKIAFRKKLSMF